MKIARERKSSVLASNAVHHRIDSLTSIVALVAIGGAHVLSDASWLDPVGGLIIAAMVIRAGWQNTMTALLELGDVSIDQDIKQSVRRVVTRALVGNAAKGLDGVKNGEQVEIKDIQGTKSGQNYLLDIDLAVPSSFTVVDTSLIEQAVRERTGAKVRGARRVRVKFTALDSDQDFSSEFIPANVSPRSSPEPEPEDDHDHDHGHTHHEHVDSSHKKTR